MFVLVFVCFCLRHWKGPTFSKSMEKVYRIIYCVALTITHLSPFPYFLFSVSFPFLSPLSPSLFLPFPAAVAERPQHMLMRVAVGIHGDDIDAAIEVGGYASMNTFGFLCLLFSILLHQTYTLMSERWFTHASPTLYNSGTCRPQLSSCFLLCMKDDSIEVRIKRHLVGFSLEYWIVVGYENTSKIFCCFATRK